MMNIWQEKKFNRKIITGVGHPHGPFVRSPIRIKNLFSRFREHNDAIATVSRNKLMVERIQDGRAVLFCFERWFQVRPMAIEIQKTKFFSMVGLAGMSAH